MSSTVVIYHANCMDGFAAAYAAYLKHPDAAFIPVSYGDPVPDAALIPGKDVYILDFSFPRDSLMQIYRVAKFLCVLDHHKTAAESLAGLEFARFSSEHSGCVMAWEFFHPGDDMPSVFNYIQDRDLWKWKLADSREINRSLRDHEMSMEGFGRLCRVSPSVMVKEGRALLRSDRVQMERIMQHARSGVVRVGRGVSAVVVNSPVLQSELGEMILDRHKDARVAVIWYRERDGQDRISFRSRAHFDCSFLAKQFGGGGHAQACGCEGSIDMVVSLDRM